MVDWPICCYPWFALPTWMRLTHSEENVMLKKLIVLGATLFALVGGALAQQDPTPCTAGPLCDTPVTLASVPLEDGGMLALAVAGIGIAIAIARSKRK